jgi:hypothetical protein
LLAQSAKILLRLDRIGRISLAIQAKAGYLWPTSSVNVSPQFAAIGAASAASVPADAKK